MSSTRCAEFEQLFATQFGLTQERMDYFRAQKNLPKFSHRKFLRLVTKAVVGNSCCCFKKLSWYFTSKLLQIQRMKMFFCQSPEREKKKGEVKCVVQNCLQQFKVFLKSSIRCVTADSHERVRTYVQYAKEKSKKPLFFEKDL